jgi:thymidylate synthase (FAD)
MHKPSIELLSFYDNAVKHATAECYGIDPNTLDLVPRVVKQNHLSILRHGFATVRISNISRVCGRQILRKAHADYLERSQRYFELSTPFFILPNTIESLKDGNDEEKALYARLQEHLYASSCIYKDLRNKGILKEDARYIFPQAIETSIVMSGNLQMWWDFFNLRINKRVQKETREVAKAILNKFVEQSDVFKLHPKYSEVIDE